ELGEEMVRREHTIGDLRARNHEGEQRLRSSAESSAEEQTQVAAVAERVEQAKTENVECLRREAELRNRILAAEERSAERRKRRELLAAEIAAATEEAAASTAAATRLADERGRLEARAAVLRDELRALGETTGTLRSERAAVEQSALAAVRALAEARSRLDAAEEVERGYGRYQEGVRAVMRKHAEAPNGVLNLVAEVIDTPPEFEKAVAAVLGERLQYVIVRQPEDAREAIRNLKQEGSGRSHFVPVEPREPHAAEPAAGAEESGRDGLTSLLDVVRVEEGYGRLAESLLGDTVLVPDLERGIELWRKNGRWRTLVTLEGEVVHPNGVLAGGSSGPVEERLLAQRREIRRLRAEVESLQRDVTEIEERRSRCVNELAAVERRAAALDESLRGTSLERVAIDKDCERTSESLRRAESALARARSEDAALEAELAELTLEIRDVERMVGDAAVEH
ncbi:MAG: hypothetical protein ACREQ9_16720, partial [Candidatus Binatia bacterium]